MDMKGQNRLRRIEQIKTLMDKNPKKDKNWIILKAQVDFGFSERLIKEYIKLIEFTWD